MRLRSLTALWVSAVDVDGWGLKVDEKSPVSSSLWPRYSLPRWKREIYCWTGAISYFYSWKRSYQVGSWRVLHASCKGFNSLTCLLSGSQAIARALQQGIPTRYFYQRLYSHWEFIQLIINSFHYFDPVTPFRQSGNMVMPIVRTTSSRARS